MSRRRGVRRRPSFASHLTAFAPQVGSACDVNVSHGALFTWASRHKSNPWFRHPPHQDWCHWITSTVVDVDLRLRRLNSKGPFGREARFIRKLFVVSDLLCAWPCVLPSHALTWNLGAGAWKMRVVLTQIGRTLSAPPKTVPAAPFLHVLQGPFSSKQMGHGFCLKTT